MANANTVGGLYNLAGPIATAETAFGPSAASTVRATLNVRQDLASGFFDGHPFKVRAVAQAIGTGAGNWTFNIYWNKGVNTNLTTFTSDVLLIGTGAIAVASKPATAFLEAYVMWDSQLQQVAAVKLLNINNLVSTPAIPAGAINTLSAANPLVAAGTVTNVSGLQFFATSTASANITATSLIELCLEQV